MADDIQDYIVSGTFAGGGTISGTVEADFTTDTGTGLVQTSDGPNPNFGGATYTQFTIFNPQAGSIVNPLTLDSTSGVYSLEIVVGEPARADNQDPGATEYVSAGVERVTSDASVLTPVCFAAGTMIATPRGERAIERLAIGDVLVTASGAKRPFRWIGHRKTRCRRHPRPFEVMPIRIAAHAFGTGRPARDLYVSPGHAICVDVGGEVLIPAVLLVNGSTIVQLDVEEVTYWHVELDSHDIVLAEGLPTESYLDMGNREFFAESIAVGLRASPDVAAAGTHADFCRPFFAAGPVVEAVRARLSEIVDKGYGRQAAMALKSR